MTTALYWFIDVSPHSDFPIQNLPYGIFSTTLHGKRRVGIALGDCVVDLAALKKVASLVNQFQLNLRGIIFLVWCCLMTGRRVICNNER